MFNFILNAITLLWIFVSFVHGKNQIYGGQNAELRQFPFYVDLWDSSLQQGGCGASILNARTVLTALHCFNPEIGWNYTHIRGGAVLESSEYGTYFAIDRIIAPEHGSVSEISDLAIVKTKEDIKFNENIKSINLTTRNFMAPIGFRVTDVGRGLPDKSRLKYIDQYVSKCRQSSINDQLYRCVTSSIGSACMGDSGSPYFAIVNDTIVQVGVMSALSGCSPNSENLISNVASSGNYDWITSNL